MTESLEAPLLPALDVVALAQSLAVDREVPRLTDAAPSLADDGLGDAGLLVPPPPLSPTAANVTAPLEMPLAIDDTTLPSA